MRFAALLLFVICGLPTAASRADLLFQVDSTQSSVNVTFFAETAAGGGQSDSGVDSSALSGTLFTSLGSLESPFGTAQIQQLDLLLMDSLSYNILPGLGGIAVNSTSGVDTVIFLSTAGAAGNVAGGTFDQLGNVLTNQGSFTVNGAGFNNAAFPYDTNNDQDFLAYQISRVGDIVTLTGEFDFQWTFDEEGFTGNVRWQGNFVATSVVPEPTSFALLGSLSGLALFGRRRR
jgi:hypothetical protein